MPVEIDPMVPHPYRIRRIRRETSDTYTFDLTTADGARSLSFSPGQFNMIYVAGIGEVPISISGDPLEPRVMVHTVRSVGSVTRVLCGLKEGAMVGLRGPYGTAWPVRAAEGSDVILVAGGIGLAPIRPAIYHLFAYRDSYGKLAILYGARTPKDLLYRKELEQWRARFDVDVDITVDSPGEDWYGKVGVVTNLIPRVHVDPSETVALVCGPEVMIRFTVIALRDLGVSPENIYVSLERNMKCGIGLCGHCQCGPEFICKDGAVFPFTRVEHYLRVREL
jgi:NAD(P)H-flavin reductase